VAATDFPRYRGSWAYGIVLPEELRSSINEAGGMRQDLTLLVFKRSRLRNLTHRHLQALGYRSWRSNLAAGGKRRRQRHTPARRAAAPASMLNLRSNLQCHGLIRWGWYALPWLFSTTAVVAFLLFHVLGVRAVAPNILGSLFSPLVPRVSHGISESRAQTHSRRI
jgi:hypothetical protein